MKRGYVRTPKAWRSKKSNYCPAYSVGEDPITIEETMNFSHKVGGIVENICKECGRIFQKAYFEDENEEKGHANYCLSCIMGKGEER